MFFSRNDANRVPKIRRFGFFQESRIWIKLFQIELSIRKAMNEITLDNHTNPMRIQKKTPIRYKLNHA